MSVKTKEKKATKIEFKAKLKDLPVKCNLCDYSCMESDNMKKHISNKHAEQKCNVCQKIFGTALEVLKHVASEHIHDEEAVEVRGQCESNQESLKNENSNEENVKLKQLYL